MNQVLQFKRKGVTTPTYEVSKIGCATHLATSPFCERCLGQCTPADGATKEQTTNFCTTCGMRKVVVLPPVCGGCETVLVDWGFSVDQYFEHCTGCGLSFEEAIAMEPKPPKESWWRRLWGY
jgi:hypothetical protein